MRTGWLAAAAGASAVVLAAAIYGGTTWGPRLGIVASPARAGSFAEATAILANNLSVASLLGAAVAVVALSGPDARRWRVAALTVTGVVVVGNVLAFGFAMGAVGPHVSARTIPHAGFELGGFVAVLYAFCRAWRGRLRAPVACGLAVVSGGLLTAGAFIESYVSASL